MLDRMQPRSQNWTACATRRSKLLPRASFTRCWLTSLLQNRRRFRLARHRVGILAHPPAPPLQSVSCRDHGRSRLHQRACLLCFSRSLRTASRLTFNPTSPTDSILYQLRALRLCGYTSGTRLRYSSRVPRGLHPARLPIVSGRARQSSFRKQSRLHPAPLHPRRACGSRQF